MKNILFITISLTITSLLSANGPSLETGQTKCYDIATYDETDCLNTVGQDGNYQEGLEKVTWRFELAGSASIIDVTTGLEWEDDNITTDKTWDEAVTYCSSLGTGWRLPAIEELNSIVDYNKTATFAIDDKFQFKIIDYYWSATGKEDNSSMKWSHYSGSGYHVVDPISEVNSVRCVNGTPFSPSQLTRNDALEIVYDSVTDLTWQDSEIVQTTKRTWNEAITYCEGLKYPSQDWRLPNLNELFTIAEHSKTAQSINIIFQNTASSFPSSYWSSTTYDTVNSEAMALYFSDGRSVTEYKISSCYVRCVHSGEVQSLMSPALINYLLD